MVSCAHDFSGSVAARLESFLIEACGKEELRRIQAIYFRAGFGDSAETVAKRTGLTIGTVRNVHSLWRKHGEASLDLKTRGGRHHAYMTWEEERRWLHDTFGEAAISGGILEVSRIQHAYEARIGRKVYPATVYDLLHRHGWRKIAPRPHHPQGDAAAQAAFRKTGRSFSKQRKKKPPE